MKKLKFGLALALLLGGFAAVGAVVAPSANEVKRVEAEAAETYSYTFTKAQFTANGQTKKLGDLSWKLDGTNGGYWGWDSNNGKGQQLGSSGKPYKTMTLTTTTAVENVSKVVVTTSGASSISAKLTVLVGGTQIGSTKSLSSSSTAITFDATDLRTGEVQLSYTQTSSKAIYIKAISIWTDASVQIESYTTNFYLNDGTENVYHTSTVNAGESVGFPATDPERNGYKFLGWFDAPEGGNKVESLTPTEDKNLYAHWEAVSYTVSFETEENVIYEGASLETDENGAIVLPEVEIEGNYSFGGWYNGDVLVGWPGDTFIPEGDVTLLGKRDNVNLAIEFADNGGTQDGAEVTNLSSISSYFVSGSEYVTAASFTKVYKGTTGLKFGTSSIAGKATFTLDQVYNVEKVVIKAKRYSSADTTKVSLDSSTTQVTLTDNYADYTFPVSSTINSLTFNQVNASKGRFYLKSIKIYYAEIEAALYETTFDANGGKIDGADTKVVETPEDMEVAFPTPTYSGYRFLGWYDAPEGGNKVESLIASSETDGTTLYAHWEEITEPAVVETTVAELLTKAASKTQVYEVTGVVSNITNTTYGNFDLVDGESKIYVYGSTTNASKLTFSKTTGEYTFSNPKDFASIGLEEGDTITMKVIRLDYNSTKQIQGIITNIEKPEPTLEEKLTEFTTNASVGFSYTKSGEDYTFSNVRLSFRGTISAELYEEVVAAGVTAAGIECSIEGEEPYTIDCSANIGTDAEGNKYVFGSLLVPEGKENIVVTGKAFVTVDGARLYLASTAHSLVSAVSAYLGDNAPALTAEQLEAVTALAASLGIAA